MSDKPLPPRDELESKLADLQVRVWRARAIADALAEGLHKDCLDDDPAAAEALRDYLDHLHDDMDVGQLLTPEIPCSPSGPSLGIVK